MTDSLVSRSGRTYDHGSFDHDGHDRPVYIGGEGPTVIVIHELAGLDLTTLDVADRLRDAGFRIVLPLLVGSTRPDPPAAAAIANWVRICISREVRVFVTGRTSPVASWLRALARRERGEGPGVGIVGMCFSGGFALATAVDDTVLAAVASQPALPWPLLPGSGRDLGLSPDDLTCVRTRFRDGELGVFAARYTEDRKSAKAKIERYREEFGDDVVFEPIGTAHSVLARAAHPTQPDPIAAPALERTIALLTARLIPGATPG
jgi:dienelactone hydrolase